MTRLFTTFTLALCALFISTSLFAQQTKDVVPIYNSAGQNIGYAAVPYHAEIALTGAVTSLTINGQRIAGDVHLVIGNGPSSFDLATNTLAVSSESIKQTAKGSVSEGNTTISGSLTVTGNCFFASGLSGATENFGQLAISYERPAVSTAVTIRADVTSIQDAGADVVTTLPGAPPNGLSRRIDIYNESATYNVTDGTNVLVATSGIGHFTWANGGWH